MELFLKCDIKQKAGLNCKWKRTGTPSTEGARIE